MRALISKYLTAIVLFPSVVLTLLCAWLLIGNLNALQKSSPSIELISLAKFSGNLVHELQKERGMSAGFLGSGGNNFSSELRAQRRLVDAKYSEYKAFLSPERKAIFSDRMRQRIQNLEASLDRIADTRRRVDNLSIDLPTMLRYYTEKNLDLIEQPLVLIRYIDDKLLVEDLIAFYNLLEVKEKAGIERANLSNLLASENFSPVMQERLYTLIAQQKAYQSSLLKSISPGSLPLVENFLESRANSQAVRMREEALDGAKAGRYTIAPETWFSAATERIDGLKQIEESLVVSMKERVEAQYQSQFFLTVVDVVLLVVVLAAALLAISNLRLSAKQASNMRATLQNVIDAHDLTTDIDVVSRDQMGQSAELVNRLLARLREDFDTISTRTSESVASTQDTIVAIVQSEENIRKQLAQTTSTASAVEELAASIVEVSRNIDETAASVDDAMNECHAGQEKVNSASESIEKVAHEIEALDESIQSLNSRVENISTVVEVIESVAEQTNLLALNAAIEAARAGEQGRGFAVVADEVRQLAQRVQSSTEEIAKIIGSLQAESKQAINVIGSVQQVSVAAVGMSREVSGTLDNIVAQMQVVNQRTAGISESGRQQAAVTNEMTESVTFIDQMSQENLEGALEISQSATVLSDMTMGLMDLVDIYKVNEEKTYLKPSEWKYGSGNGLAN